MKINLRTLLFLFFLFPLGYLQAAHVIGGELTYVCLGNGDYQITINNDLNKYRFLITLIHEMAHLVTFKDMPRSKPHGKEWKINFQRLMLPFLHPEILLSFSKGESNALVIASCARLTPVADPDPIMAVPLLLKTVLASLRSMF